MEIQEYNDIVQFWINEVLENRGKDAEKVIRACGDIVAYGMKNGDSKLIGFGYYYLGETYYCLNDGEHFFDAVSKAISYLDTAEDWELMGRCYNFLGIWAMNRGNAPIAQDYYLSGIHCCRKNHLSLLHVILDVNLGALNVQCCQYEEAERYFNRALEYMKQLEDSSDYHTYMLGIYENTIKVLLPLQRYEEAEKMLHIIYQEHWNMVDDMSKQVVMCVEAIYYHKVGNSQQRDKMIGLVDKSISENVAILDMFDDYYDYTNMLLEADMDAEFWHMIEIMEPMIKSCNIIKMQLKLISLKIRYYRKNHKSAEYLQAAGLYYELSEVMEQETRGMMNSVLNLRRSLENANRARKEVEAKNRILTERSELDPLTKIANRYRLNKYAEEVFRKSIQNETTLAVEILDIDYFKEFNDNYGHQAGDKCLVQVADAIKSIAEENHAFCARYGGDEFVLIYEDLTYEQAMQMERSLKQRVLAKDIEHRFSKAMPQVTISQGLCWGIPSADNHMTDFLHTADTMLYKVKSIYRNNYAACQLEDEDNAVYGN